MHCCLMFVSYFVAGLNFVVVLDKFFFSFWETEQDVAGRVRQPVVLCSNYCMRIFLDRLSINHLKRVVVL